MRLEVLVAALVILGGSARADLIDPPRFSAGEHRTIARNEMLSAIAGLDPWLVRQILDLLGAKPGARRGAREPVEPVDAARNPDLARHGRTAESSVEWNDLIKRAKREKDGRGKDGLLRSSEGSVELFEMMRRAKAAKGVAK